MQSMYKPFLPFILECSQPLYLDLCLTRTALTGGVKGQKITVGGKQLTLFSSYSTVFILIYY